MADTHIPTSIGVIMDGNRRWARAHGLPTFEGHRQGLEKVKELVAWAQDAGIKEVILYAFSTENWNRSKEEVEYLMELFAKSCDEWMEEIYKRDGRVRFIGQRERFSKTMQEKMTALEEKTKHGTKGTLAVALSYGGRAEIIDAVNALLVAEVSSVDETSLREAMWSKGLTDPDLIIRTSGEQRLSNFLTWQSVYSELFFTTTQWPAFTKEEFMAILNEYAERERRHGK